MTVPKHHPSSDIPRRGRRNSVSRNTGLRSSILDIIYTAVFDDRPAPFRRVIVLLVLAVVLGTGVWWLTGWTPPTR